MTMGENEVQTLRESMIRVETVLKQVVDAVSEMRLQLNSYYQAGHRETPLHCEQIARALREIDMIKCELEKAKDSDRALTTKLAVLATVISIGGGATANLIIKAIL